MRNFTNAANFATLKQWIEDKELGGVSEPFFLNDAGFRDLRDEFIAEHVNS